MKRNILFWLPVLIVISQCAQNDSHWPGPNTQVREILIKDGRYSAKTSFYYDSYNSLSGILFFGSGKVYDCEVEFNSTNDVIKIPGELNADGLIEMEWMDGKLTKYFYGDRVADLIYAEGFLRKVEVRVNGQMALYCNISHSGENIKTIEKFDGDDNQISRTDFLSYDDQLNLFRNQWWYWWIAWDKGYHWEDSFPIMLFMKNNPLSIKTVENDITYNDEVVYDQDDIGLISKMNMTGDHSPVLYTILY